MCSEVQMFLLNPVNAVNGGLESLNNQGPKII